MGIKSNRNVSLSLEDKLQGHSKQIDSVDFSAGKSVMGWTEMLKDLRQSTRNGENAG